MLPVNTFRTDSNTQRRLQMMYSIQTSHFCNGKFYMCGPGIWYLLLASDFSSQHFKYLTHSVFNWLTHTLYCLAPGHIWYYTAKTKYRNFKQIFPEKEYRGLSPNFHIHASVSDLFIPTICLPILLEEICRPILGPYKSLTDTWMWKFGLRPRIPRKGIHKWDFHCSVD